MRATVAFFFWKKETVTVNNDNAKQCAPACNNGQWFELEAEFPSLKTIACRRFVAVFCCLVRFGTWGQKCGWKLDHSIVKMLLLFNRNLFKVCLLGLKTWEKEKWPISWHDNDVRHTKENIKRNCNTAQINMYNAMQRKLSCTKCHLRMIGKRKGKQNAFNEWGSRTFSFEDKPYLFLNSIVILDFILVALSFVNFGELEENTKVNSNLFINFN